MGFIGLVPLRPLPPSPLVLVLAVLTFGLFGGAVYLRQAWERVALVVNTAYSNINAVWDPDRTLRRKLRSGPSGS